MTSKEMIAEAKENVRIAYHKLLCAIDEDTEDNDLLSENDMKKYIKIATNLLDIQREI